MLHQVLKRFKAEGKIRQPGDIVETTSWKNERLLLEHRFIGVPSVSQKAVATLTEDANVAPVAPEPTETNSKPEPPKATPMKKVVVKQPLKSGKPAVLRKRVPVVGKVPVVIKAKQVKVNG